MALLSTDALILHAADYLESSRLVRMLTREAGVVSVVARGMRSSRRRFGSAMDLFAEGQAHLQMKQGRDLHSLQGFDVTRARTALAADLERFAAASALAEVVLRLVHEEASPGLFDRVRLGLNRLEGASEAANLPAVALGTIWQVVGGVGYQPTLDQCPECHRDIPPDAEGVFLPAMGGLVCLPCAPRIATSGRRLPRTARDSLRAWLNAPAEEQAPIGMESAVARAHQRLLREFLSQHLDDSRPLKAFQYWEGVT